MKHTLALLLLASLFACKKAGNSVTTTNITPELIRGRWEIREGAGNVVPGIYYPPGNGHILEFTDNKFTLIDSGKVTQTGSYLISRESTIIDGCQTAYPGPTMDRLITSPSIHSNATFMSLIDGFLHFQGGCAAYDGASSSRWERIK